MAAISWTPKKLERFKEAKREFVENHADGSFVFDGEEFDVNFAHYLIQHLEGQFYKYKTKHISSVSYPISKEVRGG